MFLASTPCEIREISASETLALRQKVLKPHLPTHECGNPGDEDSTTLHLGLFIDQQLASVATFIQVRYDEFPQARLPYQLRGMATDPQFQGQGLGSQLLETGIKNLRQRGCDLLWFRARIKAFPFYERLGFQFVGELFELPHIGPHKFMYKFLDPR